MSALALGRVGIWAGETDRYPAPALRRAAAALPNRLTLLRDLGFDDAESPDDRLVDALVATGSPEDIARRVEQHLAAGADHVSLHVLTTTPEEPPLRQWQELATQLL
ncbi:hypothetical protein Misp01_44850 [Microtetraspora sp. NBRC 13810]|uniref:hypothetical protein n=1 Tax=Microtetraspora sp. NBRC 13810 TaxID=3030990 RepID=UPI0024A4F0BE|nr:hypothetical protein [Microtetraspora sp. NBRC 13810]GLW09356.1 hypothetical protein Misp01_44850 [Microtetraspora sp. NBRC 13810]